MNEYEKGLDEEIWLVVKDQNVDSQMTIEKDDPILSQASLSKSELMDNDASLGALKRVHELSSSDSDKESLPTHNNTLQLILVTSPMGG